MDPDLPWKLQLARAQTRRQFLKTSQAGLGAIALASSLDRKGCSLGDEAEPAVASRNRSPRSADNPMTPRPPHFAPKAKRVIYLHMSGGPPQQDLFDFKPELVKHHLQPCPDRLLKNQKFAFIKGHPKLLGSPYQFRKCGQSGAVVSELLPHLHGVVDDIAIIRSMYTDQFNHAPAELFLYTGSSRNGGAAMGSWITYGLGSENQDLPGFRRLDQRRDRPDRRQGPLEHRLSAQRLPGGAMPDRRRSRSSTSAIPKGWTGPIGAARSMRSGSSTIMSSPSSAIPRP